MDLKNRNTVITVGIASLVVGAIIGMTAEKSYGRAHAAVAKGAQAANACGKVAPSVAQAEKAPVEWNPLQEIRNVQVEMDHLFQGMLTQRGTMPVASPSQANPGYAFSLNMQDLKDRYEVHAYLPDTKAANAKVTVEGKQALKVEVSNQESETTKKGDAVANVTEWGTYEETLRLPTPVRADKMKIERKEHELLITLPKAA